MKRDVLEKVFLGMSDTQNRGKRPIIKFLLLEQKPIIISADIK